MVQEAIGLKDLQWDEPLPIDWYISDNQVLSSLGRGECWICANPSHQANDCEWEGRVAILGPKAKDAALKAANLQPRFKALVCEKTP